MLKKSKITTKPFIVRQFSKTEKFNTVLFLILPIMVLGACAQNSTNSIDFSYEIVENLEPGLKIEIINNCLNFEASFSTGACNEYKYKYIQDDNNLKIILTDSANCMFHLETYQVKGGICNLKKGQYNFALGADSEGSDFSPILTQEVEIN